MTTVGGFDGEKTDKFLKDIQFSSDRFDDDIRRFLKINDTV